MIITLNINDKLVVRFADTDGEFEIHFDSQKYPKQIIVAETAGLPGNVVGAAESILYHGDWRNVQTDLNDIADGAGINEHLADLRAQWKQAASDDRSDVTFAAVRYIRETHCMSAQRAHSIWVHLLDDQVWELACKCITSPDWEATAQVEYAARSLKISETSLTIPPALETVVSVLRGRSEGDSTGDEDPGIKGMC